MADQFTEEFLKNNELKHLVELFKQKDVTYDVLIYLRQHHDELKDIVLDIRDRVKFHAAFSRESKGTQTDPPIAGPCLIGDRQPKTIFDICKLNEAGESFLELYIQKDGTKKFSPPCREYLRNSLVEYYYRATNGKIVDLHFQAMLAMILEEFSDENPSTWYVPKVKGINKSAGGFLYGKYKRMKEKRNLLSRKMQLASGEPLPKQPKLTNAVISPGVQWETLSEDEKEACEAAKHKLRGMGFSDKEAIIQSWDSSFPLRWHEASIGKIVFSQWDVLLHLDDAHGLITRDFCKIHGSAKDTFGENVPRFSRKFFSIYPHYKKLLVEDKELVDLLTSYSMLEYAYSDNLLLCQFLALPMILRTRFVKKGKHSYPPTLLDSREAFLVIAETEARMDELLAEKRKQAKLTKTTVQPFLMCIGPLNGAGAECFVIFDEVKFKCRNISCAIDLLFKLYVVFNVEYPDKCAGTLRFIQTYFYDIDFEGQRIDPHVTAFISDLIHN